MLNSVIAQVGVGTENPASTLDVRGSLQTAFREVATDTTLNETDYYITYNGEEDATITLPPISDDINNFNGRIYRVKNVSNNVITLLPSGTNTIRATNTPLNSFTIDPGNYIEIVKNGNTVDTSATWDLSFYGTTIATSNVDLYGTILRIPHFSANITNHNSTQYDSGVGTDRWWIISTSTTSYAVDRNNDITPSTMRILYEYQGIPFDLTNLNPMFTVGNSSNFPDVFSASFGGFSTVNGKTRLALTISRIDYIGQRANINSNWEGRNFFINALFTRMLQ